MLPEEHLLGPLRAVVGLLDGSRSLAELSGAMAVDGFRLDEVFAALHWLDQQGLLREAPDDAADSISEGERRIYASQIAEFARWGNPAAAGSKAPAVIDGLAMQLALKRAVVVVVGSGFARDQLTLALSAIGVGHLVLLGSEETSPITLPSERLNPFVRLTHLTRAQDLTRALDDTPPRLLVYCSDRFDPALCRELNKIALDLALPLIFYRRGPHSIEIGPLVLPGETACFACYEGRLRVVSPWEDDRADPESQSSPYTVDTPRLNLALGIDMLGLEILKFLTCAGEPVSAGRLWRLNVFSGLLELHPVLKLPRCPACGMHRRRPARRLWEEADAAEA